MSFVVGALAGLASGFAVGLAIVLLVVSVRGTPLRFAPFFPLVGALAGAVHGLVWRPPLRPQAITVLAAGAVSVFLAVMAVIGIKAGVL